MTNDLISRSALLAEYDREHEGEPGRARALIEAAPAVDAVEVVRCANCVFRQPPEEFGDLLCGMLKVPMKSDDFCSYGEKEYGANA